MSPLLATRLTDSIHRRTCAYGTRAPGQPHTNDEILKLGSSTSARNAPRFAEVGPKRWTRS